MAADQWRKRLNSTSIVACYGRESRAKRKSNMKSHISLEWDGNQKKVVARRDQIGISSRHMRSFAGSSLSGNNIVADVLTVPQEIYALENLADVLSYEVWEDVLSESERNHLMQFLPRGLETEEVVQALLAGEFFYFGSPLLNWGSSLCSGDLHPDAISQQHQYLNNEKKAYYSELHKYHNNMIGNLQKLKESFERSPEKEIVHKTSRSKNDMDKRISSSVIESRFNALEGNAVFSSESCSWEAEEKACSSDNQKSSIFKGGELYNRLYKKDAVKDKGGNFSAASGDVLNVGAQSRKGEKRHHQQINSCTDGAKYMSYFKISKKQHDIVKSMKQSGKSIQSKSLNRVLGNIDSLDVRPYEMFVEEEHKKLREKWIQMAKNAVPVACVNWRDLNAKRQQLRKSLDQEIKERLKMLTEDEDDSNSQRTVLEDQIENEIEDRIPTPIDDDDDDSEKSISESPEREFSSAKENDSMEIDSEKETLTKSDPGTPNASENANLDLGQRVQLSCTGDDIWPSATISNSYYTSDDDLPIAPPKENIVIDLDPGKDLVHRNSENTPFNPYPNQDRNDVFDPFYKNDGMLIYPTENMLIEEPQFPVHFPVQPHPPLQRRENDAFSLGNIPGHVYSGVNPHDWAVNGARVPAPMQPHLTGELPSWYAGEHQPRWTGGGRIGNDQSLYSVLSQCNQLRSSNGSYQTAPILTEQFVPPRNYGMMGGSVNPGMGSLGNMGNIPPQSGISLDYMGGREAGPLMPDDVAWMGSGLHDPMGKPYLRSWNQ